MFGPEKTIDFVKKVTLEPPETSRPTVHEDYDTDPNHLKVLLVYVPSTLIYSPGRSKLRLKLNNAKTYQNH